MVAATKDEGLAAEAAVLHRDALVVDLHADTLIPMRSWGYKAERRHRFRLPFSFGFWHCDLPRWSEGGVNGQFFGLVTFPKPERGCALAVHRQITILEKLVAEQPAQIRMARTAADVRRAKEDGLLAALMGIEGAHNLEGDPALVAQFAARGVRYLGLAHFSSNVFCPASMGLGGDNEAPLPEQGRELIAEMNAAGMIVDLAHVGRQAFLDAVPLVEGPVIVSHTGVRGVYDLWRNLDDEQLRAVAGTDGVVGVIFAGMFLAKRGERDVLAVVRHMEHVRDTIGVRHVALGSDFDGFISPVDGLEDVSKLGAITEALLAEGWPEDDIRAVLGENALRVIAAHDSDPGR